MKTLDITDWKFRDREKLNKEIEGAIKSTQLYVIQPYPHEIEMTKRQFNILRGWDPDSMQAPDMDFVTVNTVTRGDEIDVILEIKFKELT